MRKIDAFAHILPPAYTRRLEAITGGAGVSERIRGYRPWIREDPALTELDARWRVMDQFGDYAQVVTLAVPPPEELGGRRPRSTWPGRPTTRSPGSSPGTPTGSPASPPRCRWATRRRPRRSWTGR